MSYDRDIKYVHPFIAVQLENILAAIQRRLPLGYTCKLVSAHRTPEDQLALFKQGRAFKNGRWAVADKSKVVTYKDGYVHLSRHNYLPCTALDIGIFDGNNRYQASATNYRHVKEGKKFGLEWGGDWPKFKDTPHLEMPSSAFFQRSIQKDNGYIWQQYLVKAETYAGKLDGIFGPKSMEALEKTTGERERSRKAWDVLYAKFGMLIQAPASVANVNLL